MSRKPFKQHVEFIFSGLSNSKTKEGKCSYLLIQVGEKGRNIYSIWTDFSNGGKKQLDQYCQSYADYLKPRNNEIYSHYKYQICCQSDSNPFDQFVTELSKTVIPQQRKLKQKTPTYLLEPQKAAKTVLVKAQS